MKAMNGAVAEAPGGNPPGAINPQGLPTSTAVAL
jgi:hypothetical protein